MKYFSNIFQKQYGKSWTLNYIKIKLCIAKYTKEKLRKQFVGYFTGRVVTYNV